MVWFFHFQSQKREIVLLRNWQCLVSFGYSIIPFQSQYPEIFICYDEVLIFPYHCLMSPAPVYSSLWLCWDTGGATWVETLSKMYSPAGHSHALLLSNIACWMLNTCSIPTTHPIPYKISVWILPLEMWFQFDIHIGLFIKLSYIEGLEKFESFSLALSYCSFSM